jgi:hypothetical protein
MDHAKVSPSRKKMYAGQRSKSITQQSNTHPFVLTQEQVQTFFFG